jgi:hypothetical protein
MIKLIPVKTTLGQAYINPLSVTGIERYDKQEMWWLRCGGETYNLLDDAGKALLAELQGETKPQTALDDLVLATLVTFTRDETRNNQRPMWRCMTDDSEAVNIFLNKDEADKDNYHLFKKAGWGKFLDDFGLHQLRVDTSIQIAMKKNGRFWDIVKVRTKPESDMPEWAKTSYTFDEIVTEDDEEDPTKPEPQKSHYEPCGICDGTGRVDAGELPVTNECVNCGGTGNVWFYREEGES